MSPKQLLAYFDRIAEAPGAVPRLRRFIRELAVRGKLVEQNGEEHTRTLPSKRKPSHDGPFSLPDSWSWVSVRDVSAARLGKMLDKARNRGLPRRYLRNVNVRWFDFDLSNVFEMPFEEAELEEFSLRTGDVLVCEGGEPGRAAVWDERERGIYFQKAIHRIRFEKIVDSHFFTTALRESFDTGRLATYYTGVGIKHLTGRGLALFSFPLPPLTEQHRIVAKVDELMALCDRLEAAQAERERRRDAVGFIALRRLREPSPLSMSRRNSRFYLDRMSVLATGAKHMSELRQTIVSLAVRGALVEQDPRDEPASELLRKIARQKSRSRGLNASPHRADDTGASVHAVNGWATARLEDIVLELQTGPFGSSLHQSDYCEGGTPVINPASIRDGRIVPIRTMAVDQSTLDRLFTFRLRSGDVVLARRGEMGRAAVVTEEEDGWLCGTGSLVLRLSQDVYARYVVLVLGSPTVRAQLGGLAVGATMQNLNQTILRSLPIALPPLDEQRRIVARVDELMTLCDLLETQLGTVGTKGERLLGAVLHQALDSSHHVSDRQLGEAVTQA